MSGDVTGERRYRVVHRTEYRYDKAMADGYTITHLIPRSTPFQQVTDAVIGVEPEPAEFDEFDDLFGNRVVQFGVHRPHDSLMIEASSRISTFQRPAVAAGAPWETVVAQLDRLRGDEALEISPYRGSSLFVGLDQFGESLRSIAQAAFTPQRGIIDASRELCHLIFGQFVFDSLATDVSTPLGDVLGARRGVCQDFAHLATGCLRSLGLAARYVSGYLETEPPPGEARLVGADMSHAWCSVWTPSDGWVDFDPTNDHLPVDRHLTIGWGRDFADVSPVRGVVIGPSSGQSLDVSVDVTRV